MPMKKKIFLDYSEWSASSAHLPIYEQDEVSTDNSRSHAISNSTYRSDEAERGTRLHRVPRNGHSISLTTFPQTSANRSLVPLVERDELITPSVSLPSSRRDSTRTWKEAVRNMPGETHRRLFLSQRRREKRMRFMLPCKVRERSVGYVS